MMIFEADVERLFGRIYELYSYDFRSYSISSMQRRLQAIMSKYGLNDFTELEKLIDTNSQFFMQCLEFLVVPTTEMFRDPNQFKAFKEEIIPVLATYPSLKFWIAGISTGEEVYSYAILLKEAQLLEKTIIYATDISPHSLQKAKEGSYSIERMQQYSRNYLQAGGENSLSMYYQVNGSEAQLDRSLIKNVVFADHCLATDSVFAEVEFVSCRNVLIYFEKDLQNRALNLFRESLRRKGFLAIGDKESLRFSNCAQSFQEIKRSTNLYQKLEV